MIDTRIYDSLAALLEYPDGNSPVDIAGCRQAIDEDQADARAALESFAMQTSDRNPGEMQELFTRTFDTNPATALEVGWHLFGENYDRGAFLVRMRGEIRKHGLSESSELPDHLAHVLAVVGRMEAEEAVTFATTQVLPALSCMIKGVQKLKSPYEHILVAIQSVLTARFGPEAVGRPAIAGDLPQESTLKAEGKDLW